MSLENKQASCLCGSVQISVAKIDPNFTLCHCDSCRVWGGGPFFAIRCGSDVAFNSLENVQEFESSSWANRAFCKVCGTHLYYRLKQTDSYNMPLGIFSELSDIKMDMQYFIDKRPAYYCMANETKEMTTEQITAYFASQVSE
jgi:hypothetical protein